MYSPVLRDNKRARCHTGCKNHDYRDKYQKMTDLEFLESSYPYFSMAFELLPERLHGETHLDIHITLADKLLCSVEEAVGVQPPPNMTGYQIAEYYFETTPN